MINELEKYFPYLPTSDQKTAISLLYEFLFRNHKLDVFVLKGYAGTGKTTLVSAFINLLYEKRINTVLLAPTGRAAKVLSAYSGKAAYTIHKRIYRTVTSPEGYSAFVLRTEPNNDTVFIVDEASMLGNTSGTKEWDMFRNNSLLEDLVEYVFNGSGCKLLLIGDNAQLPPVGMNESPALNISYLKHTFALNIASFELKEVVRQSAESQILSQATHIRKHIEAATPLERFRLSAAVGKEVVVLPNNELQDTLYDAISRYGLEETLVICRSNKRANLFNQQIRARILDYENQLHAGDLLIVVRNNYFWLPADCPVPFIANGDIIEVQKVRKIREMHGFSFADLTVRFVDYPDVPEIDLRVVVNSLTSEGPALSQEENRRLYESVLQDYADITSKKLKAQKLRTDPWLNALQVKYAYAITGHKSQGGQWKAVFVEQGFIPQGCDEIDFYRWLYTAITRATEKLFLVGFEKRFIPE